MNTKSRWHKLLPIVGGAYHEDMGARILHALAALLLLVQLPHLPHLPFWVSAIGLGLIIARLALLNYPNKRMLRYGLSPVSVTALAVLSAMLIKWDFGYLIGRDPCVAFLFILVAAKFAEVRRPSDATLLLCLCAFLLLTQYFYAQSIVSATITLPAVFALAYSLSILRDTKNPASAKQQLKLIFALLLQGLPIAALLFIVFPRLPGPIWSLPEDAMAQTGLSDSMSPGTIGALSQSSEVAFRVDFDSRIPRTDQLYWRGPVLTQFDGRNWALSDARLNATPTYSGPSSDIVTYTVTLQPHRQRWLFALDMAASLPKSYSASDAITAKPIGNMFADGQILSNNSVSQTMRYKQSSYLSASMPSSGRLVKDTLHLPGRNTRTIQFAQSLRAQHRSELAFAHAVMQHFNKQPFRYTLQPQLLGDTPVDEFMFDAQEGFCEHYAAAFVVILRAAGIPARVVTGYQGGEMNGNYMIVRQSDAHAWAEAYINGAWQRFDPTSAVAPERVERGLAAALPDESSVPGLSRNAPGIIRDMHLRWDSLNHQWQRLVIDFDNDSQASLWERLGLGKPDLLLLTLLATALAGLWSMAVLGMPRRRNQLLSEQELHWQSLSRVLSDHKLVRGHDESAQEYLTRASLQWPEKQARFEQLRLAFNQTRFQQIPSQRRIQTLRQIKADIRHLKITLPFMRFNRPPA